MLLYACPPGYRVSTPRRKVKLDPFVGVIDRKKWGRVYTFPSTLFTLFLTKSHKKSKIVEWPER